MEIGKWTGTIGDGTSLVHSVPHGLYSRGVVVAVYDVRTGELILDYSVRCLDENKLAIAFSYPLAVDSVRVVVLG